MLKLMNEETLSHQIISFLEKGYNNTEIENKLVEQGHDAISVKQMLFELSKFEISKKRKQAIIILFVGIAVCFLAYLFSLSSFIPYHIIYLALIGIASLGALFALAGIVMLLVY